MGTDKFEGMIRVAAGAALLALALTGCANPTTETAATETAATAAPAKQDPPVESMLPAIPSAKMGVAVDLRYSFDGEVLPNQPVTVNLAAVPRVAGGTMQVSVQQAPGLQIASAPLSVQKTNASGVYRQQFSLTKLAATAEPLRVLVKLQMGEQSGFGYFTIPLDPGTNAHKPESVKQR
jgi:hypothetical protein